MGGVFFQVYARANASPVARLGVVVGKRAIAAAVKRNYCKRFVREVFRHEYAALGGVDLVVRLRIAVGPLDWCRAGIELKRLLLRAHRSGLELQGKDGLGSPPT